MESDLSAFHRIDDLRSLHPQRLIDLTVRLGYYPGVVQSILRADTPDGDGSTGNLDSDRVVDSSSVALALDPVLGELIDFA